VVFGTSSRSKVRTGGIGLARGLPVFDRLRQRRHEAEVILCAFDLIEFDEDLRSRPIEERKRSLARRLRHALLDRTHRLYSALNFVGAAILTVIAYRAGQWGFVLLEGVWTLISVPRLILRPDEAPTPRYNPSTYIRAMR
jgi:hypothetical protein